MTCTTSALLSPRDLAKSYPVAGDQAVPVLAPLSFDVAQGEFAAIVGSSGAGRTTLPKIIPGLIEPSAGAVQINGRTVPGPPPEMVYPSRQYGRSMLPCRTVLMNVEFPLEHRSEIDRVDR